MTMKTKQMLLVALTLTAAGCTRVIYLDQETPSGRVPPPPAGAVDGRKPASVRDHTEFKKLTPKEREAINARARRQEEAMQRAMADFKKRYAQKGKPRIAVLLNRTLSDKLPTTWTVSTKTWNMIWPDGTTAKGSSETTSRNAAAPRANMAEDVMWQFEESALRTFLRARAIVIDRATILRLTADDANADDKTADPSDRIDIEIRALRGKADLFMELLIRKNRRSTVGYEFKATVKEVETGRILASLNSLAWKQSRIQSLRKETYVPTANGYRRVVRSDKFPAIDRVAHYLSLDVMQALADIWTPDE